MTGEGNLRGLSAEPHEGPDGQPWRCPQCSLAGGLPARYPPDADAYCSVCQRPMDSQERIAAALALLARRLPESQPRQGGNDDTTVNVEGAALLLHTTVSSIYSRNQRGQLPPPLCNKPLVWRKADLLNLAQSRASSPKRSRR